MILYVYSQTEVQHIEIWSSAATIFAVYVQPVHCKAGAGINKIT